MTILSDNATHHWERCKTDSLTRAKADATEVLGPSAYDGDKLAVAIDHGDGNYQIISTKVKGGRWHDRA
jgi:hypothetical protein